MRYGIFLRIQRPGLGWNPAHRSRHPKNWEPGVVYRHEEGEWEELPGMAAFELTPRDAARAIFGMSFNVAYRDELPLLMDWDEAGVDAVSIRDLEYEYDWYLFTGEKIGELPDGAVVKPVPVYEALEEIAKWFVENEEEIVNDEGLWDRMKTLYGEEVEVDERKRKEALRDIVEGAEYEDEETGLILKFEEEERRKWL